MQSGTSADIVVIGTSLGGIQALSRVLAQLPVDFPVPLLVVQHLRDDSPHTSVALLRNQSSLDVQWAREGTRIQGASVYLAPAGHHLHINPRGTLSLTNESKVNFARPYVDVLFKSVAMIYQARAIGVVLTGRLNDGASGVEAIRARGGRILVQEPASAQASGMPQAALATGAVNFTLSLDQIAAALITFCTVRGALSVFDGAMPFYGVS